MTITNAYKPVAREMKWRTDPCPRPSTKALPGWLSVLWGTAFVAYFALVAGVAFALGLLGVVWMVGRAG